MWELRNAMNKPNRADEIAYNVHIVCTDLQFGDILWSLICISLKSGLTPFTHWPMDKVAKHLLDFSYINSDWQKFSRFIIVKIVLLDTAIRQSWKQ